MVNQNSNQSHKGAMNVLDNLKINGSATSVISGTGLNKEMSSLLKSPLKAAHQQFIPITDSLHKKNAGSIQYQTIDEKTNSTKKGAVVVDRAIASTYIQPPSKFV